MAEPPVRGGKSESKACRKHKDPVAGTSIETTNSEMRSQHLALDSELPTTSPLIMHFSFRVGGEILTPCCTARVPVLPYHLQYRAEQVTSCFFLEEYEIPVAIKSWVMLVDHDCAVDFLERGFKIHKLLQSENLALAKSVYVDRPDTVESLRTCEIVVSFSGPR